MKFLWLVLSFTALSTISALGQDAKASVAPLEITGGQNLTVKIAVNKGVAIQNPYITVTLSPKDPVDKSQPINFNIGPEGRDPLVYQGSIQIAPSLRGVWYVQKATFHMPVSGENTLQIDHPEFTVKPAEFVLPTTGNVMLSK
jgi:hypothetical protein